MNVKTILLLTNLTKKVIMKIELISNIRSNEHFTDYDFKKFAVTSEEGKILTHVFENQGDFINLKTSEFFETLEEAARNAVPKKFW